MGRIIKQIDRVKVKRKRQLGRITEVKSKGDG
jgi:hypothetical protein